MLYRFIQRLLKKSSQTSLIPDETLSSQITEVQSLLTSIDELMPNDQTSDNWRKFLHTMHKTLEQKPNKQGLDEANQIWQSIHGGMGSWNDYYIPHDDHKTMVRLNDELEMLCYRLTTSLNGSIDR